MRPLKDSDELLKNFSSGLSSIVATAANYAAMNAVKDTVEFMGDFVKS